MIELSNWCS